MSLTLVDTFVPGRPKTKGSLSATGPKCKCTPDCKGYLKTTMRESVLGSKSWLALVAKQCSQAYRPIGAPAHDGPVTVTLMFALPVKDTTVGRPGDVDKLARNVLDALTRAQVYVDDVQVVTLLAMKVPVDESSPQGVRIRVTHADAG